MRGTFAKLTASSLALALAAVSCKPGAGAHADSAGTVAPNPTRYAQRMADQGAAALAGGYPAQAAESYERAVAFDPKAADYRVQLGRAYLMAGRFMSAAESFDDARALGRDDGQMLLSLALAQAGTGDAAGARDTIAAAESKAAATDRGLAMALAGDAVGAIPVLEAAARAPGADATARQNLALGYALAGRWAEARTTAAVDIGAGQLDARIAQWAALAGTTAPAARIAGLFALPGGVADPGMPVKLALVRDRRNPVMTAAADPNPSVTVSPTEPAPVVAEATSPVATPEAVPAADADGATHFVMPAAPAIVAPVAPLLRASPRPAKVRVAAMGTLVRSRPAAFAPAGDWVVQVGAFSDRTRVEAAWSRTQARFGLIANYTPLRGTVARGPLALHRLSLAGFASRDAAAKVCVRVKQAGGDCFVRIQANDAPVEWVQRKTATKVQLAAR